LRQKKRKHRKYYVKPWLTSRHICGEYHSIVNDIYDILTTDEEAFKKFVSIYELPAFKDLLNLLESEILKPVTVLRRSIIARDLLCITLRCSVT